MEAINPPAVKRWYTRALHEVIINCMTWSLILHQRWWYCVGSFILVSSPAHFRSGKVVWCVKSKPLAFMTSQVGPSHDMQVGKSQVGKSLGTYISITIAPPLHLCSRHGGATVTTLWSLVIGKLLGTVRMTALFYIIIVVAHSCGISKITAGMFDALFARSKTTPYALSLGISMTWQQTITENCTLARFNATMMMWTMYACSDKLASQIAKVVHFTLQTTFLTL